MKKIAFLAVFGAMLAMAGGCNDGARVVSQDNEKIVSLDQIDTQDWTRAAEDAVRKLINSGVLDQAPTKPAIVKITQVRNDTSQRVPTELLTQKVKIAMMDTGKARVMTQDEATQQLNDYTRFKKGDKEMVVPYFTLSGKIIEQRASAGSTRQTSYIFQLNLATVADGTDAWSGETEITKQGKKNSVGY